MWDAPACFNYEESRGASLALLVIMVSDSSVAVICCCVTGNFCMLIVKSTRMTPTFDDIIVSGIFHNGVRHTYKTDNE